MISQHQIVRLIEAREYRQLIDRILANGRCRSALARRTLARPDAAEVAAIGLAIQRICEITYRPAPQAAALVMRLLEMQREDGTFCAASIGVGDEDVILAATAVALRALITYQSQCAQCAQSITFRALRNLQLSHAIARGLDSLARAASERLRDQRIVDPACWAIILWQLGDIKQFRHRVATESLLDLLDQAGAEIIGDELARYAHAMAA